MNSIWPEFYTESIKLCAVSAIVDNLARIHMYSFSLAFHRLTETGLATDAILETKDRYILADCKDTRVILKAQTLIAVINSSCEQYSEFLQVATIQHNNEIGIPIFGIFEAINSFFYRVPISV